MSDKETVLTQLQNHQCSVQEAMAALDYIYAEKARPLLDACKRAKKTILELAYLACDLSENDSEQIANEPFNEGGYAYETNRAIERGIEQYEKGV